MASVMLRLMKDRGDEGKLGADQTGIMRDGPLV